MHVVVKRNAGLRAEAVGRAIPLSVFFNGQKVASLKRGKSASIDLPVEQGVLQVGFTLADQWLAMPESLNAQELAGCTMASLGCEVTAADNGKTFDAGIRLWVLFDLPGLVYLPYFGRRCLYIQRVA